MKIIERWFWAFCVMAALTGLFVPAVGLPLSKILKILLGGTLFFTGLKLDFGAIIREFARPGLALYITIMRLLVIPLVIYQLARLALPPALAIGVLIVAAMPAGATCSALTDIIGGNAALALVGTLLTTLLSPLVTPRIIELYSGVCASGGMSCLLEQAGFLSLVLLLPISAGLLLRRLALKPVEKRRELWSGLALLSLFLLICGALASVSGDFKGMLHENPGQTVALAAFMCFFSSFCHTFGYLMAPWRTVSDRAAASVNVAYVNNAVAIVFAAQFFKPLPELGAAAVLPAIFLEIPMDLAIAPLRTFVRRKLEKEAKRNASALAGKPPVAHETGIS